MFVVDILKSQMTKKFHFLDAMFYSQPNLLNKYVYKFVAVCSLMIILALTITLLVLKIQSLGHIDVKSVSITVWHCLHSLL